MKESAEFTYPIAIDARLVNGTHGGDSTYWTGLLFGFSKLELELSLYLFSNVKKPDSIPWRENWTWITIPSANSRWWSYVQFPLSAKKIGAKVIHGQYNVSPLAGKRGVTTIHDVSFLIGPQWFSRKDRFILQKFVPSSARTCGAVIAVSNTDAAEIERYLPFTKGKIFVTQLASPPWIEPRSKAEARARISTKWGVKSPFALTVGTKNPRKNQACAIEAARMAQKSIVFDLVIAGKGTELLTEPGVIGLGYVSESELCDLYSAAEVFLFPSLHEGFGIPVLEAFTCACPVICGPGGAIPEVASDGAILLPDFEIQTWSNAIVSVLAPLKEGESSNLEEQKNRGLSRAELFSWEDTAMQTLNAYRSVVNK